MADPYAGAREAASMLRHITETDRRYHEIPYADRQRIKRQLRRSNNYPDPTGYNRPTQDEVIAAWESERS
jgi:hypothetical protein